MSKELLTWYDQVKRPLPWRVEMTPYKVWLSEIMLQQTQVSTVVAYFNRFISEFPDVYALAKADEERVFKLWEGLGYYSRARNLMKCARILAEAPKGRNVFPETVDALMKLPGIGPYTAGAISSIAFGHAEPAIDGNVHRVISRLHQCALPIQGKENLEIYKAYVIQLMSDRPGDFTQAMMELGATVCTPKNPKCDMCPLNNRCESYLHQTQTQFPVKIPKPSKKEQEMGMAVVFWKDEVLVVKGDSEGLLANLWGFPRVALDTAAEPIAQIQSHLLEQFNVTGEYRGNVNGITHIFTHLKWKPTLFFIEVSDKIFIEFPIIEWLSVANLDTLAFSTAMSKQFQIVTSFLTKIHADEERHEIRKS